MNRLAMAEVEGLPSNLETNPAFLSPGDRIVLFPRPENPLHKEPVKAVYLDGYFWCEGADPADGPDYYLGDVLTANLGWNYIDAPHSAGQ